MQKKIRLVFTVSNYTTSKGAIVREITPAAGFSYKALTVGETGRGRREARIPIKAENETRADAVSLYLKNGQPRFERETETNITEKSCIAILIPSYGFGGGARFETISGKCTVLAEGNIARGDAGGMASASQAICIVEEGTLIKITRSGRLYGASSTGYHFWDGHKWTSTETKEEMENFLDTSGGPVEYV